MSVPDVFLRITTALDQAGIGYVLFGSFASAHYGAPRSTQDIDLVIEATPARSCERSSRRYRATNTTPT
jgi:predicted nucleotidyltransferase